MNNELIFNNRASVINEENLTCDNCHEHTIFFLKDNYHEFSMGLSTVLECVMFAIRKGDLPKLPDTWLDLIDSQYRTQYSIDKNLCYHDYHKKK